MLHIVLSSPSIFLNSKANNITNFKSFNSVNKSISLFLIAYSVSLSYSSWLKEFKILKPEVLAYPFQARDHFAIFPFFSSKTCSLFLYKRLLKFLPAPTWETFSTCLIALNNLREFFGCSVTDFV